MEKIRERLTDARRKRITGKYRCPYCDKNKTILVKIGMLYKYPYICESCLKKGDWKSMGGF